ncbi:MAG: hypothetical protein RLY86_521 [Pseudomonadota bacterium]|jgi:uncharacterized protein (DUF2336 family)
MTAKTPAAGAAPPALRAPALGYDAAKAMAADPDPSVRAGLAARGDVRPELLYYLADDDEPAVRRAVAANALTPVRASTRLARDRDDEVRALLAGKLARLLPHLTGAEQAAMNDLALNALNMLAADQLVRVRAALASAIKDVDCAPPRLVATLARDMAREVAEPVLRTCVQLSDEDLLGIIAAHPVPWVLEAIARRPSVSPRVAEAVGAGSDPAATAAPQGDPGAAAGDSAQAAEGMMVEPALGPGGRPILPARLTSRLAEQVELDLRDALADEAGFDPDTADDIVAVARRRLDFARDYSHGERPEERAARLFAAGALTEEVVWDAISWGDRAFMRVALALLARIPPDVVQRILDTQSAKAVTALAWSAGLSMRGARLLQQKGAGIHPRRLLNARHGTDYPLSEEEMRFQLELFGIE